MLWSIVKQVLTVFSSALTSAYTICAVYNTPFYNPALSKIELINTVRNSAMNLGIIGLEIIGSAWLYYPYLDNGAHSWLRSASNIIEYSMWIELFYYGYHRLLHTTNWYYLIHVHHHKNRHVYPIDTLSIHWLDSTGMILTLIAPLWFVQVNQWEHDIIMFTYLTGAFLSHSKIFGDKHAIHHERFKCNYCFLFPVFDRAFGTTTPIADSDESKTD